MLDPMFDSADYMLCWPASLLARELAALRTLSRGTAADDERIKFLLEEAFIGDGAVTRHQALRAQKPVLDDPWGDDYKPALTEGQFLDNLIAAAPQLRLAPEPRPYWPERQGRDNSRIEQPVLRRRFVQVVLELRRIGHFGADLPEDCVDAREEPNVEAVLNERLGIPALWPLQPERWDDDTFYGLIEVFHDLSVRPRERWLHQFDGCGWHFRSFGHDTGQALDRWRINRLLDTADVGLRLADDGEDVGRLVHVVDDARDDLLDRALATPDPGTRGRVEHAIALFRGRGATEHHKRSAIVALATVLEDRKKLLKASLFDDDESALFHIANKFDLRHSNDKQHQDYDPAFRDWVFWWYLATIELTDQLLARQTAAAATSTSSPTAAS